MREIIGCFYCLSVAFSFYYLALYWELEAYSEGGSRMNSSDWTLACNKCGSSFWGKGKTCGDCKHKGKPNPFSILQSKKGANKK